MRQLTNEEHVELGLSVQTGPLIAWATEQLDAAKSRQARLDRRGATAPFLKELQTLVGTVAEFQLKAGKKKAPLPPALTETQRIRSEAMAYRQEAKQIVKIEFGTCPDAQQKFRPGVRTGGLLSNLRRELECVVAVLREHAPQLAWLGVDDAFIGAGESLVCKLNEAQMQLDAAIRSLPPALAGHCVAKGQLYDLCRKLVRIGQLAFLKEPEQAASFNYSLLRKDLRPGSEVRIKTLKAVSR